MLSLLGRAVACGLATWLIYAITSKLFDNPLAHMPLTVVFASAMWAVSFAKYVLLKPCRPSRTRPNTMPCRL
ncbi:hypothetical protein LP420_24025 [Massilia sp. B-10]|nr:hypothetical protein LP420_24025 [Massilia sp. B-10]